MAKDINTSPENVGENGGPENSGVAPEIPAIDPEKARQARNLHAMVSVIRLFGVFIMMIGIAAASDRIAFIPVPAGYAITIFGACQMLFVPYYLIRSYVRAQAQQEEEIDRTEETRAGQRD